jgi:hypothetical protein
MHVALTNHPVLHPMDKPAFIRLQSFGALEVFFSTRYRLARRATASHGFFTARLMPIRCCTSCLGSFSLNLVLMKTTQSCSFVLHKTRICIYIEAAVVVVIAGLERICLYVPTPFLFLKFSSWTQPGPGRQGPRGA